MMTLVIKIALGHNYLLSITASLFLAVTILYCSMSEPLTVWHCGLANWTRKV